MSSLAATSVCLQPALHNPTQKNNKKGEMSDESAVAKFWRNPDLVGSLLNFLDGGSILRLATCHHLTKEVSQKSSVWTKLVRRTCPVGPESQPMDEKALVRANKKKLAPLLELLKMAEDPSKMKLTLLEVICERFPHTAERVRWDFPQFVKVGFSPSDKEHRVSALGFLLLDEVESRCKSSPKLVIDSFDFVQLEVQMLAALSRQACRQEERIKQVRVWDRGFGGTIWCTTTQQAKNLLTIVKKSDDTSLDIDLFVGNIKKQGWAALGKMAELHGDGPSWRTFNPVSKRDDMLAADRDDLRKIWDAMHGGELSSNSWRVKRDYLDDYEEFYKSSGNREWGRLVKVLNMSQEEWNEYKGDDNSESEDGESLFGDSSFEAEENMEGNQG